MTLTCASKHISYQFKTSQEKKNAKSPPVRNDKPLISFLQSQNSHEISLHDCAICLRSDKKSLINFIVNRDIVAMSDVMKIRDYLTTQVIELETLQAVYPDELVISDHGALADINEFISGGHNDNPGRLAYSIKITVPEGCVDLHITLPLEYPGVSPDVYARGSALDRTQQTKLNDALIGFAKTQDPDEPCIYAIVSWMQDHLDGYLKHSKKNNEKDNRKNKKKNRKPSVFGRYWIYSHHIYSNIKRKDMADEAKECQLSGFCLAGKPGIICVEGSLEDCEYWWQKIKVMNWHKILLKLVEEENLDGRDVNTMRKFVEFQEISFPTTDKHNDMGQLLKYLTEHQSQHVFKDFFGVEGKITSSN